MRFLIGFLWSIAIVIAGGILGIFMFGNDIEKGSKYFMVVIVIAIILGIICACTIKL